MIGILQQVLERALERLSALTTTYLPPLLAGLAILAIDFVWAHRLKEGIKSTAKKAAGKVLPARKDKPAPPPRASE